MTTLHKLRLSLLVIGLIAASIYSYYSYSARHPSFETSWQHTDFSQFNINLAEVTSGGIPKDGIPAIDTPHFITPQKAKWLKASEPVIALGINGDHRAYPLQIMMYHEIVNDIVGGQAVSITFCPLCNAAIVFKRQLDQQQLDFGTTGLLRNSDMIMYDRQTQSWWQQFTGKGIVGTLTGQQLQRLPSQIIAFELFTRSYPQGKVLSRKTGHRRPYGNNPYRGYDDINSSPFLFNKPADPRLPPMERVLAIQYNNNFRLYPFSVLQRQAIIHDEHIVIFSHRMMNSALDTAKIKHSRLIPTAAAYRRQLDGQTLSFSIESDKIIDQQSQSEWNSFGQAINGPLAGQQLQQIDLGVHFAFAWLAFHPSSKIYQP